MDNLVRQIVSLVNPLKIILFGSAAREEMNPDSDIDLLVVMPEGTHRIETMIYFYSNVGIYKVMMEIIEISSTYNLHHTHNFQ